MGSRPEKRHRAAVTTPPRGQHCPDDARERFGSLDYIMSWGKERSNTSI